MTVQDRVSKLSSRRVRENCSDNRRPQTIKCNIVGNGNVTYDLCTTPLIASTDEMLQRNGTARECFPTLSRNNYSRCLNALQGKCRCVDAMTSAVLDF